MRMRRMMMAKTSAPPLAVSGTFGTPVDNGDPLTGSLTITGGVSPYSVSVYSGTAPPGVTFSVSGSSVVASGNTTTNGSYSWTLRVTSTDGQHADSAQSVTVQAAGDPYWSNVVALLHFDGSDGSTTFTDQTGKAWTANGNAHIDTSQSDFGGSSLYCDGSGDSISTPDDTDFDFGAGDFTIECSVRFKSVSSFRALISKDKNTGRSWQFDLNNGTSLRFAGYGVGTKSVAATVSISTDTWYRIAVSRVSGVLYILVDGILKNAGGTSFTTNIAHTSTQVGIGQEFYPGNEFYANANFDEVRITKGVGRYTGNYTPDLPFPNS